MKHLALLALLFWLPSLTAQNPEATAYGGEYVLEASECVPEALRQTTIATLKANTERLKREGLIPTTGGRSSNAFVWPVRQVGPNAFNSYYGISNFVDHNPATNNLQDYNCGTRTYDLNSGYDHRGTDIFTWPFSWHLVNNDQVEAIAAADGVIIGKEDGNVDTNCDFSNPNWNAVFLRHTDGTVTWYGHLKNGSVTTKPIGASVSSGEYLGVVASSGSSTGPHLHFEVWEDDTYTNLLDPYEGVCNDLNGATMWVNQENYRVPTINHVMTNSDFPVFNNCPQPATINEQSVFLRGDRVVFSAYFRDHLLNDRTELRIIQPNGSTWSSWSHTNNGNYNASWWTWFWDFPGTEPVGTWTFEVRFMGQVQTTEFEITNTLPVSLTNFTGEQINKSIALEWTTENEENNHYFAVERSADGQVFDQIGRVEGNGNQVTTADYGYLDEAPLAGNNYYRLKQVDFSGESDYSTIIRVRYAEAPENGLSVYPNPVTSGNFVINNPGTLPAKSFEVVTATGQLVGRYALQPDLNDLRLELKPGLYFLRYATADGESVKRVLVQ
ncbi:MAG: peptidoglycan DD-metalloendopeptidase family protein [Bacteroidota bacterium]